MGSNCRHLPENSFKKNLVCKKCGKKITYKMPTYIFYILGFCLGEFLDFYLSKYVFAAPIIFFIYLFALIMGICLIQWVINPLIGYKEFYPFRDV
ncbi:MAG: hypothetical protein K0R71_1916 [Bacillales bacterium]|jgi:hypothetical protein|nr:hypothetical protein [Bacillales bacterium]